MSYKPDPEYLKELAGKLRESNKLVGAITNLRKAANILFKRGDYIESARCYREIANILLSQGKSALAISNLRDFAKKLEDFKIYDVSWEVYKTLGEICNNLGDFENSMMFFQHASDLYMRLHTSDPDGISLDVAGDLLIKSGEAAYNLKSAINKEKSERLIMKGLYRATGLEGSLPPKEQDLILKIKNNKFEEIQEIVASILALHDKALAKLDTLENNKLGLILNNVKSKIIHRKMENLLVYYLVSRKTDEKRAREEILPRLKKNLQLSINLLKSAIQIEHDKEDLERLSFDWMIAVILNDLTREQDPKSLLAALTKDIERVKDELEKCSFFKVVKKVTKYGLQMSKESLYSIPFGNLEPIKSTVLKLIFY
ncbi:MAG: hypothetical protein ACTSXP_00270 [Promethearchaeota archaeon]